MMIPNEKLETGRYISMLEREVKRLKSELSKIKAENERLNYDMIKINRISKGYRYYEGGED